MIDPENDILLSIILPAHNEQERISDCLEKVNAFLSNHDFTAEVIVVENGSSDRTVEIVEEYQKKYPWLKLLQTEGVGKGLAVKTGMLAARGQYRFFADVDFSMPVEEILHFIPPQRANYSIAIGSREVKGAVRYNEPSYRHFTGRIFNNIVQILAVPGIMDTQCGFKCFSADAAEKIFPLQRLNGWAFDVELLYIARKNGFDIQEVPVHWYYDGQSKVNVLKDSFRMFKELLQIRRNGRAGLYKIPQ